MRHAPRVRLEPASRKDEDEFLASVRRSTRLHRPWVDPPSTAARLRKYLARHDKRTNLGFFVRSERRQLVGVVNVNEIVRGVFQSAYLGYYGFVPHDGQGYMTAGLTAVVSLCFRRLGLHRLEANIQPGNRRSIALVKRLGFRREGYSARYLKIGGRWQDHERWAITRERWRPR